VLRIFGSKWNETAGVWIELLNEELHNSHSSLNIIRTATSGRTKRAGNVEGMEEKRNAYKLLAAPLEGRAH
jgi:hypothetical protein